MSRSILIICIPVLFLFSCGEDQRPQYEIDQEKIEEYLADHNLNAQIHDSGVYYIIEKEGTGDHPNANAQSQAVFQTLEEIEADHIPVISALNKIDLLENSDGARKALQGFPKAVAISALTGEGINDLLKAVNEMLFENFVPVSLWLPYREGGLISMFHEQGHVDMVEHGEDGISITGMLPNRLIARYSPYKVHNV